MLRLGNGLATWQQLLQRTRSHVIAFTINNAGVYHELQQLAPPLHGGTTHLSFNLPDASQKSFAMLTDAMAAVIDQL